MATPQFHKETIARMPDELRSDGFTHLTDIGDVDGDGDLEIVFADPAGGPAMISKESTGWEFHRIDEVEHLEHDGVLVDLTGTGTLDLVCANDYRGSRVYWWENPGTVDGEWTRRTVIDTGKNKFHDLLVADLTGDGRPSLVVNNQCLGQEGGTEVRRIPIPDDPTESPWPGDELIASGNSVYNPGRDSQAPEEGLVFDDVDGDGAPELVSGTHWYERDDGEWIEHQYADDYITTMVAVADIDGDGANEIVLSEGDALLFDKDEGGKLGWFDPGDDPRTPWTEHRIDDGLYEPHTLQIVDVTETRYPDVVVGEVGRTDEEGEYTARLPRIILYENHGDGTFTTHFFDQGTGIHDGLMADVDGDGTDELVGKPVRAHQHHEFHCYRLDP